MVILIDKLKVIYIAKSTIESIEIHKDTRIIEVITNYCKYTISEASITRNEEDFVEKFGAISYLNSFAALNVDGRHNSLFITGNIIMLKN